MRKPEKINGKPVVGDSFAYDGCYKFFVCETKEDEEMMERSGYTIVPIEYLEETYRKSNVFSFIDTARLTRIYADQFEPVTFEYGGAE